jgi:hypothetical protein
VIDDANTNQPTFIKSYIILWGDIFGRE